MKRLALSGRPVPDPGGLLSVQRRQVAFADRRCRGRQTADDGREDAHRSDVAEDAQIRLYRNTERVRGEVHERKRGSQ